VYLVSFDFYCPSKCGSYFCRTLYNIVNSIVANCGKQNDVTRQNIDSYTHTQEFNQPVTGLVTVSQSLAVLSISQWCHKLVRIGNAKFCRINSTGITWEWQAYRIPNNFLLWGHSVCTGILVKFKKKGLQNAPLVNQWQKALFHHVMNHKSQRHIFSYLPPVKDALGLGTLVVYSIHVNAAGFILNKAVSLSKSESKSTTDI